MAGSSQPQYMQVRNGRDNNTQLPKHTGSESPRACKLAQAHSVCTGPRCAVMQAAAPRASLQAAVRCILCVDTGGRERFLAQPRGWLAYSSIQGCHPCTVCASQEAGLGQPPAAFSMALVAVACPPAVVIQAMRRSVVWRQRGAANGNARLHARRPRGRIQRRRTSSALDGRRGALSKSGRRGGRGQQNPAPNTFFVCLQCAVP